MQPAYYHYLTFLILFYFKTSHGAIPSMLITITDRVVQRQLAKTPVHLLLHWIFCCRLRPYSTIRLRSQVHPGLRTISFQSVFCIPVAPSDIKVPRKSNFGHEAQNDLAGHTQPGLNLIFPRRGVKRAFHCSVYQSSKTEPPNPICSWNPTADMK